MISRKRKRRKKKQQQKNELTIDKALLFSAVMIILFTVIMVIAFWQFQSVPDSLVVAFFGAFGLEGGYCAFIHKLKKDRENKTEIPDIPDEGNLEIDLNEEGES